MTASKGIRARRGSRQLFVDREQGKHVCACGCDETIPIKPEHANVGVPRFIHGHNQRGDQPSTRISRARDLRKRHGEAIAKKFDSGMTADELASDYGEWGLAAVTLRRIAREFGASNQTARGRFGGKYGPDHPYWKGGSISSGDGYRHVWVHPDDPMAVMKSKGMNYVREHRLVMARHLGRPLKKGETVHHIDGDRLNNDISNLQLRQGRHGIGAQFVCGDCGSQNVQPKKV